MLFKVTFGGNYHAIPLGNGLKIKIFGFLKYFNLLCVTLLKFAQEIQSFKKNCLCSHLWPFPEAALIFKASGDVRPK
jgi:hypothetical protein